MNDQELSIPDALAVVRRNSSVGRSLDVLHVERCGCQVVRDPVGCGMRIEWCELHGAAGEMREACSWLAAVADTHPNSPLTSISSIVGLAKAALAKARGLPLDTQPEEV